VKILGPERGRAEARQVPGGGPLSDGWLRPGRSIVFARGFDAGARFLLFFGTAHFLTPAQFSRYALLTAVLAMCQWTLSLGGPRVALYFASRGSRGPLFAWLLLCAAVASGAVLGTAAASEGVRGAFFPGFSAGWVLLGLAPLPFSLLADSTAATLLADGRTREYGATLLWRNVGSAVVLFSSLAAPDRLLWILWGRLAVQAAIAARTAILSRARPAWAELPGFVPRALAYAGPTAASEAAIALHRRVDVLLLSALGRGAEIGAYGLAYALAEAFWLVTDSLEFALFVDFARDSAGASRDAARRAARIYLLLGAAALALGWFAGRAVLALLFSSRYPAAPALFPWLLAAAVVWGVSRPFFSYLSSQGRVATILGCNLAGLTGNVALNVVWIPRHGAAGAATACLVSYALEASLLTIFFWCARPSPEDHGASAAAV
jgi:O-antigen/teichoic acid export membrane protein